MGQILKDELDEIFVDVRKGYRLLYLYQRRVLDTIKFIEDTLSKHVESGWTLCSDNIHKDDKKINLDSSACAVKVMGAPPVRSFV